MSVILTAEQFTALKRVQSLEAQKQRSSKMGDAVEASMSLYLLRNDPVQKAQRATQRKAKRASIEVANDQASDGFDRFKQRNQRAETADPFNASVGAGTTSLNDQHQLYVQTAKSDLQTQIVTPDPMQMLAQTTTQDQGSLLKQIVDGQQLSPLVQTTKSYARVRFAAAEVHAVHLKSGGRCCLIGRDGKRCECDRWLEIHHIIPVSQGGANDIDNLVHLCGKHHDLIHQEVLPLEDQVTWWTLSI